MKKLILAIIIAISILGMISGGCLDGDGDSNGNGKDGDDPTNLGKNARSSECGGFDAALKIDNQDEVDDICGDERLIWTFDETSRTVSFLNQDVWLNCCGEHSITVSFDEESGVYEIAETDAPEMLGGEPSRCHCMCLFDFAIDLPGVSSETIDLKLTRDETDDEEERMTVWLGEIDLSAGSGDILIEENVGWCTD